jgi:tetratricopeptide (TPR) repeat protein
MSVFRAAVLASLLTFCGVPAHAQTTPAPMTPAEAIAYVELVDKARQLSAESPDLAAPLFADAARRYPDDGDVWLGLATALRKLNRPAEAIAAYRNVLVHGSRMPSNARYWIAVQQAGMGDADAAIATLEQLVFEDHDLDRPGLWDDASFTSLKANPRFAAIVGRTADPALDRTAGRRADLIHLIAEIGRLAPGWRGRPLPARTLAIHRDLHDKAATLTDDEMLAGMNRLLASLELGHTLFWGASPSGPQPGDRHAFTYLPVLFHAFPEGLFIVSAAPEHAALIGARLVALEATPADQAIAKVTGATSASGPIESLWTTPVRLSEVQLLHGLGVIDDPKAVTLTIERNGVRQDIALTPGAQNPRSKLPAPPNVPAPRFLAHVDEAHWLEALPGRSAVYAQVNQIADDPDETLAAFGLRLRQTLGETGARAVVLDLRHNNGGNTFTYVELLRTLTAFSTQPDKRVYVLIGRSVYSAAANLTTDLERLVQPVFVGEATAMTGNQDGDEGAVRLPWSGLRATVSGVDWQLSHPWDKRASITPHVPVSLTADAYFGGRDPVMDAVLALLDRR